MKKYILPILFTLMLTNQAVAVIWHVGATQTYTMPSQVSTLVGNGDTVNIDAGTYNSNVCAWTANNLLLRCVNGTAHLKSNGLSYGDKGIWVIQGNNTTVEHIEFSLCTSTSSNGAGIRQEGQNLTIRKCYFHDNENGILAGAITPCKILIEYSEFNLNGAGDGYSHNLYIGHIDTLVFRYNYSHHCKIGHELKSRANINYILYNRLSNEATGTASREIDLPNGGLSVVMGNIIHQGPNGTNSGIVGYGLEGLTNTGLHNFYLINNTIVNEKTAGTFVSVVSNTNLYKGYNNIFAGQGSLLSGMPIVLDTLANKNYVSSSSNFVSSATYFYQLVSSCSAIDVAVNAGVASNGFMLTPTIEYQHIANQLPKLLQNNLDIGAFEYHWPVYVPSITNENNMIVFVAEEHLTIRTNEEIAAIKIIGLDGKLIYESKTGSNNNIIPVSQLAKGIYVVSVTTASKKTIYQKFVIQ